MDTTKLRQAHKVLKTFKYTHKNLDKGYADQTLYINLSSMEIKVKPVTPFMKETFTGGKGYDLYLMWQAIDGPIDWNDPKNEIVISGGPICGSPAFSGSGKCLVTGISPLTHSVMDCNVGGHFGPLLKFSGFDALELQGKASEPVIVVLDDKNQEVRIETAPDEPWNSFELAELMHHMYADSKEELQSISAVTTGEAAEHTLLGCLNFSWWDWKRNCSRLKQAGRGGLGTVFRHKNVKAMVGKCLANRPLWEIHNPKAKVQAQA